MAIEYPDEIRLARDVAFVLHQGRVGNLHPTTVAQVLRGACWWTSNRAGKYDQCVNWSAAAAAKRLSWTACPEGASWPRDHGLVHEHIVPRKYIQDALSCLPNPSVDHVRELLALSENCIVTEEEDRLFGAKQLKQRMPEGCTLPRDKWARYSAVGIERHASHPFEPKV